ncbi:Hypothetical predicted protein [Cloeon dipterum]|uniref:Uncharacterized protein n=1 Tax=Cloeon dipterum TaxID=197152 RepID=A0A8S1DQL3_9INSE|nr:Hypothetical predicted protein [Cloeon dipterum]
MTNRFFLTFSILASEQAEIWISGLKKIFSRKIVIDGNGDRHWTSKQHLIGKIVGDFIGEAQQIEGKPILNGGKKWTHVSIDFRNSPLSLNENEDQLNLGFGSPAYICDGQKCLVNFKSKGNGIFKVHEFNMLAPNKIDATLELKVQENVDRFCVDVVFYYWNIASTAFELSISQEERILQIFSQPTENATLYRWVTRRFENSVLNLKGKWTVRLTAKIQEIFLGGIKFCAGGESIVRPKGRNMKSCNLLAKRNPENEQTTKKKLEEVINDSSLCKTLGGPCSEFSACAENSGCVFSRNKNPVRVTTKGWMLMLLPPPKESANTRKTTTETPEVITLEPATTTAGANTTETTKTIPYFTHSLSLNIVKFIFTMVLFSWLLLQMKRLGKMAQGIESERSASPANDEIKTFTQERGEEFNLTSPRDLEP